MKSTTLVLCLGALLAACSAPAAKKPPPKAEPRFKACEVMGTAEGCASGERCCWMPPTMYETPVCLPGCKGKGKTFCVKVLGHDAQCNTEDGCCMWPKVKLNPVKTKPEAEKEGT